MSRSLFHAVTVAAIFLGALAANLREAGTSPIAWSDTFNDEIAVRRCLVNDSCTLMGIGTSIPGYFHAVGWLELRSLLAWLGFGFDEAHLTLQLLNALRVALVFDLATQLGGQLAGIAAVSILSFGIGRQFALTAALYNSTPLLFLGTVFVLACTAVVERPGFSTVASTALVGAVMANIHLACILTGASVVWVAILAPRHRTRLVVFGVALFALATFAVAPPSWLHNAARLVQRQASSGNNSVATSIQGESVVICALFALGAWAASRRNPAPGWARFRRQAQGPFAVIFPLLVPYLLAPYLGIDASPKYLAHITSAAAIAAALPFALIARNVLRKKRRGLNLASPRARSWLHHGAPFALALLIALTVSVADDETPTMDDLAYVAHVLRDVHGWNSEQMIERVKTPAAGMTVLMGLHEVATAQKPLGAAVAGDAASALLMLVKSEDLPRPLPPSWQIAHQSGAMATVLILTQSQLDWSRFEVCARPVEGSPQHCAESGLRFDEGAHAPTARNMPGPGWRGTLTLRVPLRSTARASSEAIFMPRLLHVCGGHIAAVADGAGQADTDRRHAVLSASGAGTSSRSTIELVWQLGTLECDGHTYDGLPPFIVAGDPSTVQLVEAILRKSEG